MEKLAGGLPINESSIEEGIQLVTKYGLNVVGGIIILVVGWIVSRSLSGAARRGLRRTGKVDDLLAGFIASLVKYAVMAVVIIAVLNQFGVQTTSLIAVFGAAGLAIGLALQGTLSNVAAGVMLMLFRPFKVGQYVEVAGQGGTVKEVSLFTTELATPDNVQIIIPNGSVWGASIVNYSHHETRRVDFELGIGYGDSIDDAFATIKSVVDGDARVFNNPEPVIVVGALADSSVNIIVRIWVNSPDYWNVKFDLTKAFKEALDAKGITIPFPQRDVHLVQPAEAAEAAC